MRIQPNIGNSRSGGIRKRSAASRGSAASIFRPHPRERYAGVSEGGYGNALAKRSGERARRLNHSPAQDGAVCVNFGARRRRNVCRTPPQPRWAYTVVLQVKVCQNCLRIEKMNVDHRLRWIECTTRVRQAGAEVPDAHGSCIATRPRGYRMYALNHIVEPGGCQGEP